MKKVLLVCAAVALFGLCSCNKYKDCKCSYTVLGVETSFTVPAENLEDSEMTCSEYEQSVQEAYSGIKCVEL